MRWTKNSGSGQIQVGTTQTLSPLLHYDCLMLLVVFVMSPLVQVTSQEITLYQSSGYQDSK